MRHIPEDFTLYSYVFCTLNLSTHVLKQNTFCKVYRAVFSLLTMLVIFHTQEPSICKFHGQPFFKKPIMFSSKFVQCTCRPCTIDMNLSVLSSQFHYLYVFLFSWRYNPLWLYFHSPVADFSLLVFEVS
jgi:hypothetical protein